MRVSFVLRTEAIPRRMPAPARMVTGGGGFHPSSAALVCYARGSAPLVVRSFGIGARRVSEYEYTGGVGGPDQLRSSVLFGVRSSVLFGTRPD